MIPIELRDARSEDRARNARLLRERWGSVTTVSRGVAHDASALPAIVAERDGALVGLATYRIEGDACELVTLDSLEPGRGLGSRLLEAVAGAARRAGARRLWLITSNDNLAALRFYQRRGLRLCAVHTGAIDAARRVKPSIPRVGEHGIAIHDELELELALDAAGGPI